MHFPLAATSSPAHEEIQWKQMKIHGHRGRFVDRGYLNYNRLMLLML